MKYEFLFFVVTSELLSSMPTQEILSQCDGTLLIKETQLLTFALQNHAHDPAPQTLAVEYDPFMLELIDAHVTPTPSHTIVTLHVTAKDLGCALLRFIGSASDHRGEISAGRYYLSPSGSSNKNKPVSSS